MQVSVVMKKQTSEVMDRIRFKINGKPFSVGSEVDANVTLLEFIRRRANLLGTKYMCLEAGCGACIASVIKSPGATPVAVNTCMVIILSCQNWEITTIEKVGNRLDGYHPIQNTLAKYNGTQCGHCSPGWVMSMYCLLEKRKDLTMLDIEKSFASNICRCTGYRSILDAFKRFAKDAPKCNINDIEDLTICNKTGKACKERDRDDIENCQDWCIVNEYDVECQKVPAIILNDGKYWYKAERIQDIFDIFKEKGDDSYMLVSGNTAKGVYPIDEYPRVLIDISDVTELKGFKVDQNLIIRSGTTLTEVLILFEKLSEADEYFGYLKILHQHLGKVAHIAVRNVASIAGNLMIKHAHNEFPSDVYLLLETIGAYVTILHKPSVKQVVTMEQFLTVDMRGKVILNVLLPPYNEQYKIITYKIMPRAQNAIAIVNAGFLYKYNCSNNKVLVSRIVYGGLSPTFIRAKCTENVLVGKMLFSNETLQFALGILGAEIVVQENPPQPSVGYRKQVALALFYKSLLHLSPVNNINPKLRSGSTKLDDLRPVSSGMQTYDTKPSLYPLTQPIPKIEGLIQCAGEATYTEDQPTYAHEVFAALVLSTVPTGTIVSIDPSEALKQPGAIAFYSAKDIPGLNSFTPVEDVAGSGVNEEVFSSGEIKYFNQPIGVVAAETKHIAEKIAKLVIIEYTNIKNPIIDVNIAKKDPKRNVLFEKIDAVNKGNDIVKTITGSSTSRGQNFLTMENVVCITRPTEEGMEVYVTSQWIDGVQTMISRALKLHQNRIDVYVRRIGGGFGLKISRTTLTAVACSLVTFKLNRPCRFIMALSDITRAFGKRFPCSSDYEVAIDSKGTIQNLNLKMHEDNGFCINEKLQMLAVANFNNCYDGSRWDYQNISTITDTAKNTWFRAPGHLESVAIVEEIMEHISSEMSLDPIAVRLGNLDKITAADMIEVVNTLKKSSEYDKRKSEVIKFNANNRWKKRGIGTCFLRWFDNGTRNFNVNLSVFHGDGTIVITHGGIEMGQGINTKAIQICAYILNLSLDKIQIKANSTNVAPNAAISGGSLTTQYITIGVQKCALELLKRLIPIRNLLSNPTWEELIKKAFEMDVDLQIHEYVGAKNAQDYFLFGATVAEVEIDVLTGERQILRVDLLEDVGQSPSPEIDIGQIEGAFVMGIGYWLTEHLVYDNISGELLTNRTWNYHVPQARDIPLDFRISFRKNSYSDQAILGSKLVGEPPICMAVAIPHAIRQALTSARLDSGIPSTRWFEMDGTYTLERVCLAAATNISEFKFH